MIKREKETLEAKLRNQLSPLYSLADVVIMIDKKPELIPLVIDMAKEAIKSKEKIKPLLKKIEAQHNKK